MIIFVEFEVDNDYGMILCNLDTSGQDNCSVFVYSNLNCFQG